MTNEKVSQNELDMAYYVAQKLSSASAMIKNPFRMLEQTTQVLCDSHDDNGSEVDLTVQRLLEIPMSLHHNVLNSYVNLWAKKNQYKNDVDEMYEKLDDHKLDQDDQELIDVLKNALSDVQEMIEPGYRTPLILLNMLYVKKDQLDDLSRQAVDEVLDSTDKKMCVLTGAWLKQVASWQS